MALLNPNSGGVSTDKSIILSHYNDTSATNTKIYEVPSGKKFVGYIYTNGTNDFCRINGNQMHMTGGTAHSMGRLDVTLLAGDVINSGNSQYVNHMVVGIESDA